MKIGFVGFGNMAQALCDGFVRAKAVVPSDICACARDWQKLLRNTEQRGIRAFESAAEVVDFADLVIVAVKPHTVEAVLSPITQKLAGKMLLSVVAGYDFERYAALLLPETHHISTIPNTPVAVCEGIVVCERRHSLTRDELAAVEELLSSVGLVQRVDTPLLSIAGTICGCSPAFVSMFIEALSDAAVKHGIARADAYRMASQMVAGTGKLQLETGQHPAVIKDAVCSPAGTTIVGVAELERQGFRAAVIAAIDKIVISDK